MVVEAAGNGSIDLDISTDPSGDSTLNRGSSDFQDSGAIMVGAGSATVPHSRLSFSNHGSRIDAYGWGESIDTTGDGWTGTSTTTYTGSFGGTSGASPIVAGAALLFQAWRRSYGLSPFTATEIRCIRSDPRCNTSSADPTGDRIGAMPNLRGILEHLE